MRQSGSFGSARDLQALNRAIIISATKHAAPQPGESLAAALTAGQAGKACISKALNRAPGQRRQKQKKLRPGNRPFL